MKREHCSACGHDGLHPFLDLGSSPIADAYTTIPDEQAPVYPLEVAVCTNCHLAQLLEVLDHEVLFATGYSFYTSASPPLSAYHQRYAAQVLDRHSNLARRGVVEIGCNDGDFLRHLAAAGCPTLGVDPADGPAGVARNRGLQVVGVPFTAEVARNLVDARGPVGVVVANHVLAHVADVADVLQGVALLLADDGVAMVEVQYLPDLLTNNAFDLVYHEHRQFFSLTSLERAADRWGLHVADAELTTRQGGSLRLTLTKQEPHTTWTSYIRNTETWLDDLCAYDGVQGRVERIRTRLWDLLAGELAEGRTVAGYGAPAKATTLLNFCRIDHGTVNHVVDTTTAKQGRHIPNTGVRIVAPGDAPPVDTYLLLAHNYLTAIVRRERQHLTRGGRWIVPIPAPILI